MCCFFFLFSSILSLPSFPCIPFVPTLPLLSLLFSLPTLPLRLAAAAAAAAAATAIPAAAVVAFPFPFAAAVAAFADVALFDPSPIVPSPGRGIPWLTRRLVPIHENTKVAPGSLGISVVLLLLQVLRNRPIPGLQEYLRLCFVLELFTRSLACTNHHTVHEATVLPRCPLLDFAPFQPSHKVRPKFPAQNSVARLQALQSAPGPVHVVLKVAPASARMLAAATRNAASSRLRRTPATSTSTATTCRRSWCGCGRRTRTRWTC